MKKKFLLVLSLLCMASLAMADKEYKSSMIELNATQMDRITAGAEASADAIALGEGLIAATVTDALTFSDESNEGSTAVAGGAAAAVGPATEADVQVATGTGGLFSNTFNISAHYEGNIVDIAGQMEIANGFSLP